MLIGQLAERTGLSVRTLRFYADAGVLPEAGRTERGYRRFGPDAVARARLVRTLRELGVGLDCVRRVLAAEATLADVAAEHARAIEAQIRLLRLRRALLTAFARSCDPEELHAMTDLAALSAAERRRIVDDYLDAVFGDARGDGGSVVADKYAVGTPELPDDPTPEQLGAWVEVARLLADPDFAAASRRMAERAEAEGPAPGAAQLEVARAVGELCGAAFRAGVDPASPEALAVVEHLEAMRPAPEDRAAAAERIEAFTDRQVAHYWQLVGVVNGWPPSPDPEDTVDAWEWYARALRAHASPR